MMDSVSSFSTIQQSFPDAELMPVEGSTCNCYRVRLYGKLHFLKQLKPELQTNPRHVAALQKEFETGYSLEHPHLVRYVSKGSNYLLMEYVDGEALGQLIKSDPDYFKSRKNADRFVSQLLDVVGYLHQHQIVHLDLKPDNILITRIGHDVKLIDLGYCYTDAYTETMGLTEKYAAPEQLDGSRKVDARTDIFAIGRILQTLPCAHKYNKVIRHCLQLDPEKRYQSIEEITTSLKHVGRWWWWVVLALFFVSLAVVLLLLTRPQLTESPEPSTIQTTQVIQTPQSIDTTRRFIPQPIESPVVILETPHQSIPQHVESSPVIETVKDPAVEHKDEPVAEVQTFNEDTLALRRELQHLIGSRFRQSLGHYNDSVYNEIDEERFAEEWVNFEWSLIPLFHKVRAEYQDKISLHTIDSEWCQTLQFYRLTQFWQMMRNDPDHDSFYDGKVYHYYDADC
jgi:serine/threonine protein kinase